MADKEFLVNLTILVSILIPTWIWLLVLLPMILKYDTPEYKLSEEARQFRRTDRRIMNIGTWVALIMSTLMVVVVIFGT